MLKRPFNLIHSIDSNNYYTLETADVTFLVTETGIEGIKDYFVSRNLLQQ